MLAIRVPKVPSVNRTGGHIPRRTVPVIGRVPPNVQIQEGTVRIVGMMAEGLNPIGMALGSPSVRIPVRRAGIQKVTVRIGTRYVRTGSLRGTNVLDRSGMPIFAYFFDKIDISFQVPERP